MKKSDAKTVYEILNKLGIEYQSAVHEPVMTMEDCSEPAKTLGGAFCKNLFLANRQQTCFYLLLIEENKKFRTAEVSKKIGVSRLSFGNEEMLYQLLGVYPGAITAMGLIHDKENKINLIVDKDVMAMDKVCVHACVNNESLIISLEDFQEKFLDYTGHKAVYIDIEG